jgi:FlaA1/EpsC-like NDP-sugar epimerase
VGEVTVVGGWRALVSRAIRKTRRGARVNADAAQITWIADGRGRERFGRELRRLVVWFPVDWLTAAASFYVAYALRFLDDTGSYQLSNGGRLAATVAGMAALFAVVNWGLRIHRRAWQYPAGAEVLLIASSIAVSTVISLAWDLLRPSLPSGRPIPISVVLVGAFFTGLAFTLVRYRSGFVPAMSHLSTRGRGGGGTQTRALVYGAGELGQLLVRRLQTHALGRTYRVVGFVDDDRAKQGMIVHGVPVLGGRNRLQALIEERRVDVLLMAMGQTEGEDMREILNLAHATSAQIKVADDVVDWIGDRYSAALLRDMRPEDLIGRSPVSPDRERCGPLISRQTVLVTGACGSIGSELVRQLLLLEPGRIVALDNNESGLFDLAIEIRALRPDVDLHLVVGDVKSFDQVEEVVRRERPDIIFHVAAYKHVGLMQSHPDQAIWTNVYGTWVVSRVSEAQDVRHLVLVSTDKAVNPSSVMGATKRMAEELVQYQARTRDPARSPLVTTVVRFGNVLGSRGSVIPTFEKQIALGGPVTVTDSKVTRFFMHTAEAAGLIIEAAALGGTGDLFMLDMGERVRIDDLARKMIRMRGLRPNVDVDIVYTGLREGEKMHEELTYGHEERLNTSHPRIFRVHTDSATSHRGGAIVETIERYFDRVIGRGELTSALSDIVADVLHRQDPPPRHDAGTADLVVHTLVESSPRASTSSSNQATPEGAISQPGSART